MEGVSTTGTGDPVGQKCLPCDSCLWQAGQLPSQVCQLKANKGEPSRRGGGMLRHGLNELSLLLKYKFKQQVDIHIYRHSA